MTFREIYEALASSGLPVTYLQWHEGQVPALPYVCYYFPNSDNMAADDSVYQKVNAINVELYTKTKDPDTETAFEDVLASFGIVWQKSETYLNDEHMFEVLYESEVLTNGE